MRQSERKVHTIRGIASKASPTAMGSFRKTDFDLDFADSEVALIGQNLTLQRFDNKRFLSILV
jgi:hypothetical protein